MTSEAQPIIKPGVFFAPLGRHGVLMDLATNRYLAIAAESRAMWEALAAQRPLSALVQGYAAERRVSSTTAQKVVCAQIRAWEEAGVVTSADALACDTRFRLPAAKPAGVASAVAFDRGVVGAQPLSMFSLVDTVISRYRWHRFLFRRGLAATLLRIQGLQSPRPLAVDRAERHIRRVLRAYLCSRLPFRQGDKDCLARSLSLAAQLRACGREIDICIGIGPPPFTAHCWLEWRGHLLNEAPAAVRGFTVIARF